ncbi:MAG: hypothetical protein ACI4L6_00565 [Candidatus Onthoplasma sp.]
MDKKEKERYTIESFEIDEPSCIYDNKTNQRILSLVEYNWDEVVFLESLLNQQDKRIKELENMNSRLSQGIYWGNGEHFCDVVSKLKKENQQLRQQLHDLPKKIVEEIEKELNNIVEVGDFFDIVTDEETNLLKQSDIDKLLDTILKKYENSLKKTP